MIRRISSGKEKENLVVGLMWLVFIKQEFQNSSLNNC